MDNHNLWQTIRTMDKDSIVKYYQSQNYIMERRQHLNAGI
jgi:hypothetical protein